MSFAMWFCHVNKLHPIRKIKQRPVKFGSSLYFDLEELFLYFPAIKLYFHFHLFSLFVILLHQTVRPNVVVTIT